VNEIWRAEYPFKSHYWDRQGLKLHYVDEGQGEPVVMVHGNPSWSFYYRKLIADLSKDHRVIAPDHIGMGLSDKPTDEQYRYTLQSRVDDLEGLLDSLKVQSGITLIVHDWGGMIGMAWACRHPERIKRLVITNTWAFDWPAGVKPPWQIKLARGPLGSLLIRGFNAFSRGAAMACASNIMGNPEVLAGYLAPYSSWDERRAVLRFVEDIPVKPEDPAWEIMRRTGDTLYKLADRPMLIVWGGRDFVFNRPFFDEWRRRFPKAEVLDLPEAKHYVLEDSPELMIPAVRAFVQKHPSAV